MPKDDVEEAEVNAYMDSEAEKPNDEYRKAYLKQKYERVKSEYRVLWLEMQEARERKEEKRLNELTQHCRENFKARKWYVMSLYEMGEDVKDPHVKTNELFSKKSEA